MGLHLEIKHGRKLTFCIPTIPKREREWEKKRQIKPGKFPLQLNTVKLFSQKKNTVGYFIYTYTPHSYIKTRRLQIRKEIISSLHLQVNVQLTQFLYIISKSS